MKIIICSQETQNLTFFLSNGFAAQPFGSLFTMHSAVFLDLIAVLVAGEKAATQDDAITMAMPRDLVDFIIVFL